MRSPFATPEEAIQYFKNEGSDPRDFAGGIAEYFAEMTKQDILELIEQDDTTITNEKVAADRRARCGHHGATEPTSINRI